MSTERKELARNTVIQVTGKIVGTFLGLGTFVFLNWALGDDGYGVFTKTQTYASVFAILVDFGLTITTAQMISEPGADEEKILGTMFSLRTVSAFVILSLAPITSLFLPMTGDERVAIFCFAAAFFFSSVAQVFVGVFQKRLLITRATIAETASRLVAFIGVVGVWYWHFGIKAASLMFIIGAIVHVGLMITSVNRHLRLRLGWDTKLIRLMIKKSWPIGVSIFFNLIYLKGDVLFMWLFGRSDTEIGYYGAAYRVIDAVTTIPTTLMGLLLPLLVVAWLSKNKILFNKRMQDGFDVLALLGIPFAFGCIFAGVGVMTLIKPSLASAGQVLAILGPAVTAVFIGSLFSYTVIAIEKQKIMTLAYAFVATLTVFGYAIFIPRYGMWAAAGMSLFAEVLIGIIAAYVVIKTTNWTPNLGMAGKALAASLAMSVALYSLHNSSALISVPIGIIVYIGALASLGGPNPKSLLKLFRADSITTEV